MDSPPLAVEGRSNWETGSENPPPGSGTSSHHHSSSGSGCSQRRKAPKAGHPQAPISDLAHRLAAKEQEMQGEVSMEKGSTSGDSEERDTALLAQQMEEELEKRSNISSNSDYRAGVQTGTGPNTAEHGYGAVPGGGHHVFKDLRHPGWRSAGWRSDMFVDKDKGSHTGSSVTSDDRKKGEADMHRSYTSRGSSNDRDRAFMAAEEASRSGSGSSLSAKLLLQQLDDPSSGSSCTSSQKATLELWQQLMDSQDARAKKDEQIAQLEASMQELLSKHGREVSDMQKKLMKSLKKEVHNSEDNAKLMQTIASMEAKFAVERKDMQERATAASKASVNTEERIGDLEDQMAGVEARAKTKMKMMKEDYEAKVEKMQAAATAEEKMSEKAKQELSEENVVLQSKLKASTQASNDTSNERDVLRRNMQTMHDSYRKQVESLTEQLQVVARKETDNNGQGTIKDLQMLLASRDDAHRAMSTELSEMRMEMLKQQKGHNTQVGDLRMLLDQANLKLQESEVVGGVTGKENPLGRPRRMKLGIGKKGMTKLNAIEEDDNDLGSLNGSITASLNVSSDPGNGVAELDDFDDLQPSKAAGNNDDSDVKINQLKEEMAEDRKNLDRLREEIAGKDAQHSSKIARLMEMLKASRAGQGVAEEELAQAKRDWAGEDARHSTYVESLVQALQQAKEEQLIEDPQKAREEESVRQQLNWALEAKRIAEARLEDLKREMASMARQHEIVVQDLTRRLQLATSGTAVYGNDDEAESSRQQIRQLEEERNVLINAFEGKEVQWRNRIENMEQNTAAEVAELKRQHDSEVKELTCRLEAEISELRQRCEAASEAQKEVKVPAAAPPGGLTLSGFLANLRCPLRASGAGSSGGAEGVVHAQDICWRVLNAVKDITALLCSIGDYKIMEASKMACLTWGSAALQGKSVLTLVNGPSSAAWLRKAFETHQRFAEMERQGTPNGIPGFIVRDLGCEEFTTKSGQTFDSSVITAHLPAEPRLSKEAALVVIIEPHGGQHGGPHQSSSSCGQGMGPSSRGNLDNSSRHRTKYSTESEVSTSTVNPSDSASNILVRGAGMWASR